MAIPRPSEKALGWRVMPQGRVAHFVYWDSNGERYRYVCACGTVYLTTYVTDDAGARHCVRCERAIEAQKAAVGRAALMEQKD